jgi:hypothetical protein
LAVAVLLLVQPLVAFSKPAGANKPPIFIVPGEHKIEVAVPMQALLCLAAPTAAVVAVAVAGVPTSRKDAPVCQHQC